MWIRRWTAVFICCVVPALAGCPDKVPKPEASSVVQAVDRSFN